MKTVIYKTNNGLFVFEFQDVIDRLQFHSYQNVRKATEIWKTISSCSSPVIEVESDYFSYIALDLIKARKCRVYCKECGEVYASKQLISRPVGFGRSPFEVNFREKGGIIRRLFGRRKHISGMGGDAYDCPRGHELISRITWIS